MSIVSIDAIQLQGLNIQNLAPEVTISNVTVNLGFTTVTCPANSLKANWVGMGGFRVLINGVPYTAAYVQDRQVFVLTSAYAGSSSTTATVVFYKYVELRFYCDREFVPLGETTVVQSSPINSSNWFRRYAASIVNEAGVNNLYLPPVSLKATTDSLTDNTARYEAAFYRPEANSPIEMYDGFESFRLPPTSPTTWPAILTYNRQQVFVQDISAYTKDQIDGRLPPGLAGQLIGYLVNGLGLSPINVGAGLALDIPSRTLSATAVGSGGMTNRLVAASGPMLAADAFNVVSIDGTGGARIFELLPAVQWALKFFYVQRTDASSNAVTVDGNGAEQINGAGTLDLSRQWAGALLYSTGTEIRILASHLLGFASTPRTITASSGSLLASDRDGTVFFNTTSNAIAFTLLSAVTYPGFVVTMKKLNAGSNYATLNPTGGQLIGASTRWQLCAKGDLLKIQSDGANWQPIIWPRF